MHTLHTPRKTKSAQVVANALSAVGLRMFPRALDGMIWYVSAPSLADAGQNPHSPQSVCICIQKADYLIVSALLHDVWRWHLE